jgi:hypothetical protein
MALIGQYLSWAGKRLPEVDAWCGKLPAVQLHGGNGGQEDFETSLASNVREFGEKFPGRRAHLNCQMLFGGKESLAAAGRGEYNGHYAAHARNLKAALDGAKIPGEVVLRIAPEMNGSWMLHSYNRTGSVGDFAKAFIHMVNAHRKEIPSLKYSFCGNWGQQDPTGGFPGVQYVDYLGVDFYMEKEWHGNMSGAAAFEMMRTNIYGLDFYYNWAKRLGLPLGLDEFGFKSITEDQSEQFGNAITAWAKARPEVSHAFYFNEPWNGRDALTNVDLSASRPRARAAIANMTKVLSGVVTVTPTPVTAPTPTPVTPAPAAPVIGPEDAAALSVFTRMNPHFWRVKDSYAEPARSALARSESVAFWALVAAGIKAGFEMDPKQIADATDAAAVIVADLLKNRSAFTGDGLAMVDGYIKELGGTVPVVARPTPTTPVPVPDSSAEIATLKAAVAKAQAEAKAAQDALAAFKKKVAELVAA